MQPGLKSTKYEIWQRLINRFALESTLDADGSPRVSTLIQPVTQVDSLLEEPKVELGTMNLETGGADTFKQALVVPAGKRWKVTATHVEGLTGTATIEIRDSNDVRMIIVVATMAERVDIWNPPLFLDEDWKLGRNNTLNAGDASRDLTAHFIETDARF